MFGQADSEYEGRFYAYETDRVVVKELSAIELKGRFPSWLNDPLVSAYSEFRNRHISFEDCAHYVEAVSTDDTNKVWACYCKNSGMHMANVSLKSIDYLNATARLECLIGEKEFWGKGYGEEICRIALDHGYDELGLNRICCSVPSGHNTMSKLADKLGFIKEGVSRKAWQIDGNYVDVEEYGMLRDEYENAGG